MADERTPAISTGTRGLVQGPVEVRTGARDLHSGLYGGAVLNATHVLMEVLRAVAARTPTAACARSCAPASAPLEDAERESWARLPSGADMIAEAARRGGRGGSGAGVLGAHRRGASRRREHAHRRRAAHGRSRRSRARQLSIRLAPGQSAARDRRRGRAAAARGRCRTARSCRSTSTSPSRRSSTPTTRRCSSPPAPSSGHAGRRPRSCRMGGTLPLLVRAGRAAASRRS